MRVSEPSLERSAFGSGEGMDAVLDGLGHDVELLGDDDRVRRPGGRLAEVVEVDEAGGDLAVDAVLDDAEALASVAAAVVDEFVVEDDAPVDCGQLLIEPDPRDAVGVPQHALGQWCIDDFRWTHAQKATSGEGHRSLRRRNKQPPLSRGRTQFTDATYTASQTGPSTAPDLDFDMGQWGRAADAARVANWLAARLTSTLVTLTGLEIDYDPRLQLGGVITVDSTTFYGFSLDCLIIGKSEQHGNGSHMTLAVRVIRVRSTVTTYAQFEAAYNGRNYAALESAWAGATYSQLESNPLGGS